MPEEVEEEKSRPDDELEEFVEEPNEGASEREDNAASPEEEGDDELV